MPDDMILNDVAATITAHGAVWRPSAAPRHRKPRSVRKALTVALVTVLGLLLAFLSVHPYGFGSALNGGFYWHAPFTPHSWSFGYEVYGTHGWFGPNAG